MSRKAFEEANKRPSPPLFSIWFSWLQRQELERLANGDPWATYIKRIIFSGSTVQPKTRRFNTLDRKLIAKLLGALGQSRIASNLNQLAKAAHSGSLQVNEEVHKAILQACKTIEWMRITLIEALSLKAHRNTKPRDEHKDQSHDLER